MSHKKAFEAVDRSLRDIVNPDYIFGGIPILLCGDLGQILHLIPHGSIVDEVNAYTSGNITKYQLTTNMRAQRFGDEQSLILNREYWKLEKECISRKSKQF